MQGRLHALLLVLFYLNATSVLLSQPGSLACHGLINNQFSNHSRFMRPDSITATMPSNYAL